MLRYIIKLNCFVLFVLMFICLDTQLKSSVWASGGGPGACLQNMEGRYLSISGGGSGHGRSRDDFKLGPFPMGIMPMPYAKALCPMQKPYALCPIALCQSLLKNLRQISVKTATVTWGGGHQLDARCGDDGNGGRESSEYK